MNGNPSYFVSSGEFSGDLLAAELVSALREVLPGHRAFGVAGDATRRVGVEETVALSEFGMMGLFEVARGLSRLRLIEQRILRAIDERRPEFAVLVDFPGFHLRLAEQIHLRGVKVIQYVAPKLWAHGEGRAAQIRRDVDLLLGVLPFETEYFARLGVPFRYVGSPHRDRIDGVKCGRAGLGLPVDAKIVACLPGSRVGEVARILPTILEVRRALQDRLPEALFVVPVAPSLDVGELARMFPGMGEPTFEPRTWRGTRLGQDSFFWEGLHFVRGMSLELMGAADAALVASGTATLECALLGTPMVAVYRMNPLTYKLARMVVKIEHASLPNIILGGTVVREFLQDYEVADVAAELASLVLDDEKRRAMKARFDTMRNMLTGGAGRHAALAIAEFCHASR